MQETPESEATPGESGQSLVTPQLPKCFVVMPLGRTDDEAAWYSGWYKECIQKAVLKAEFEPILAAAEDKPNAINDEIRAHLALDPMVVIDLGGVAPEEPPNPNVMYELGIRHAFGLPLVLLAWKGQKLPFDISNQRVIMEGRRLVDLEVNIAKLVGFIKAASEGNYYRPMDAIAGRAHLVETGRSTPEHSFMKNVMDELTRLKNRSASSLQRIESLQSKFNKKTKKTKKPTKQKKARVDLSASHSHQVFHLLGSTELREKVRSALRSEGISQEELSRVISSHLPLDVSNSARTWDFERWLKHFRQHLGKAELSVPPQQDAATSADIGEAVTDEPQVADSATEGSDGLAT